MIAALFVENGGCYYGIDDVDPWPEARDAREYRGYHPVVAHPPCQRWGRFWHGSPRKPHQYKLGDDKGCFYAAIRSVRLYGGVLEHPAHSHAWGKYPGCNLTKPQPGQGWVLADDCGGYTCHVEQGHYGHPARKATWLYAHSCKLPDLDWSIGAQRLDPEQIERYGYEKARRIGWASQVGGKHKTAIRERTPEAFRDVLLSMARSVTQ